MATETISPQQAVQQAVLEIRLRRQAEASAPPVEPLGLDAPDWERTVRTLFPRHVSDPRGAPVPFAPHHADHWRWVFDLQRGLRPRPLVEVWPRGAAKSTSAEMGVTVAGARRARRYVLYACHEIGTPVRTPDQVTWHAVEDHPTAQRRYGDGYEIRVFGLPAPEVVTSDHRYWARTVARRDRGHGRAPVHSVSEVGWIRAEHLTLDTWIAYPIERTQTEPEPIKYWDAHERQYVDRLPAEFSDPEWWWLFGLWWGDGTLFGARKAQIGLAIGDADDGVTLERVRALLRRYKLPWNELRRGTRCTYLYFAHSALARWLATWRKGPNRKEPPAWAEQLRIDLQRALVRGYVDADGCVTTRSVSVTSIHYEGLLALRRILMRLGVGGRIYRLRGPGTATFDRTRTYFTATTFVLRFSHGARSLGFELPDYRDKYSHPAVYVDGDVLWSRVRSIRQVQGRIFVPITTTTSEYLTHFGRSHNCESQDQADDHVGNIAAMFESREVDRHFPELGRRLLNKFGSSKGWRRNRLRCANGFTVDAIGLDTAARGVKLEDQRPDMLVLDDIDSEVDSLAVTARKIKTLTTKLLPAGSQDLAVLAVQNLVHPDSIFSRLVDGRADFLSDRIVSGPIRALEHIAYEERGGRWVLTHGEPTWEGMGLARCQDMVDTMGLSAFLSECQHEVTAPPGGMYDHVTFQHVEWADLPDLVRTVVAVDPAVTDTDQSDAHGIHAEAIDTKGVLYSLFSWEDRTSPLDAMCRAILKAVELGAEKVIVETDQGGDTWQSTYELAWKELLEHGWRVAVGAEPIKLKQGTRKPIFKAEKAGAGHGNKVERQARVLADYEKGRIKHAIGTHDVLERALKRFPLTKPLDLADSRYWTWNELRSRAPNTAPSSVGVGPSYWMRR